MPTGHTRRRPDNQHGVSASTDCRWLPCFRHQQGRDFRATHKACLQRAAGHSHSYDRCSLATSDACCVRPYILRGFALLSLTHEIRTRQSIPPWYGRPARLTTRSGAIRLLPDGGLVARFHYNYGYLQSPSMPETQCAGRCSNLTRALFPGSLHL